MTVGLWTGRADKRAGRDLLGSTSVDEDWQYDK